MGVIAVLNNEKARFKEMKSLVQSPDSQWAWWGTSVTLRKLRQEDEEFQVSLVV